MEKRLGDNDITFAVPQRGNRIETSVKKLEKDITREICDWLFSEGYFFWRSNNVPVFQRDKYGARFRALPKYTPRGLPDIIILDSGLFIALEVKVPGYWKFTDAQQEIKENITKHGGAYHLTTSLEDTKDYMGSL